MLVVVSDCCGAKIRIFLQLWYNLPVFFIVCVQNRLHSGCGDGDIPYFWYAKCQHHAIAGVVKSPYLCTVKLITDKDMAKIYVNGDVQEVNLPLNLTELIKQSDVQQPEMVSVQVNEEFAEREDWDSIQIQEDDKVDFLYFMGGGSV